MTQTKTKAVTEKKAHADTRHLCALREGLQDADVTCLIVKRLRVVLAHNTVEPVRHQPGELLVFGPDGIALARVTVCPAGRGAAFRVTSAGDAPERLFIEAQAGEAIAYLRGLVRGHDLAAHATP
ncbi:hypothetical protein Skr01_25110 [Sphaerisporangium krabiense]|uniref:Uncharacterized protein n=1 Tax=Sphaerisporangium krabiense TaxID=763782 RepID=A0A7W8ZAX0_9ACTN|nr:hypothetical protein [Sphaerisporangium krabiense]MBB5630617.1 hypothetical protein [Sphaerisporangium krabiense]GII62426.1 hypothetical protein Skr01_25110 [Sphaerisporangium krabiense]